MSDVIKKNRIVIKLVISGIQTTFLGIYIGLFANRLSTSDDLINAFQDTINYLPLLVITLLLSVLHFYLTIRENSQKITEHEIFVNSILKAACSTLIYPNNNLHIRAIISVCDYNKYSRKTKYAYNINYAPERTGIYDLDFGVTGKAIKQRVAVAEELLPNHMDTYTPNNRKFVEPDLKCVLAAPIFSVKDRNKVVAVLAFDSIDTIEKVKFNTRKSKEIAQMWADIISQLI